MYGTTYSKASGMSKEGKIVSQNSMKKLNNFQNVTVEDKYLSTSKMYHNNKMNVMRSQRPHEVFLKGYDTLSFKPYDNPKETHFAKHKRSGTSLSLSYSELRKMFTNKR